MVVLAGRAESSVFESSHTSSSTCTIKSAGLASICQAESGKAVWNQQASMPQELPRLRWGRKGDMLTGVSMGNDIGAEAAAQVPEVLAGEAFGGARRALLKLCPKRASD